MKRLNSKRTLFAQLESLENRVLLDIGLGSEIAQFESEEELKSVLIDRAVDQHEWLLGQEQQDVGCGLWCVWPGFRDDAVFVDLSPAGGNLVLENTFSDTNVQVSGVDEGDIVETDGNYVYILSNNLVTIVDVREAEHPRVASRVHLDSDSHGREMYLDGDRLMVISNSWSYDDTPWRPDVDPPIFIDIELSDAIYWGPSQTTVLATVIDVSDREDATIVSRTEIDGALTNSRVIDGTGYLIVDDYLNFPTPELKSVKFISEDGTMERTIDIYETEEQYRTRIESTILDVIPSYSTRNADNVVIASDQLATVSDTYSTSDPNFGSLVSIVTIDMHAAVPTVDDGTTVMMDSGHEIFMSTESLYLFQSKWGLSDTTSIMKFDINEEDGSVEPTASGIVSGRMLDQFSADEFNGDLRIATTSGWGNESTSGVYVLEEVDEKLTLKGGVAGLAKGEQIFSARFVGERAYIVTFRQIDPLFSIDLADPANPVVEGELKIPGFSEYMQPIGEDHLLAIGRDADPRTGRSEGLQLSLFNVADITDPQLVDRYTFEGGNSTYSPAEHDHHAFSYYPEFNTLAIPVQSDGGTWIRDGLGLREFVPAEWGQSLHVFQIDVDAGFEFVGDIEHPSQVRRSLRVNDAIYSISYDTLKVNSIENPENQLGQIHYLPPANGGVIPTEPKAENIDELFQAAATTENNERFDLDGNQLVNEDDVTFMVEAVLQTELGDANLDGNVDFTDFLVLSANFGQEGGWAEGDFDGDGEVTFNDFTIFSKNFGN